MVELNFKPRLYQETILGSCERDNCLVVLPTGMGKTKIAILTSAKRLESYPNSKILFLTPTKPLVNQIAKEFINETDIKDVVLFTGEVSPEEREASWDKAKVVVSTPQCIENDIINNKVPLKEISLIVFDEAHRAVKGYAYPFIAKSYVKRASYPRIIGLTASPGGDVQTIEDVCKNLFVKEIEVRNEESVDVKEYVQNLEVDNIKIELGKDFLDSGKFLKDCYESKIKEIKELGIINRESVSKGELIGLQGSLQGKLARGERDFSILRGISLIAESIKVLHALELLESQSVDSCYSYMSRLYEESKKTKVKATRNLVRDLNFKSAYVKLKTLYDDGVEHPKMIKLKEIVKEEFKDKDFKMIIFNQYRDNASRLEKELSKIEGIKPKLFVGQMKKDGIGLSQKKQAEILDKFREGEYNCLISTSVGEEGLDIPKVNLVVFYEPVPSAIRAIQRRGRTARHDKGKIIVLISKNTRDEVYFWIAHHKEKRMYRALEGIRDKIKFKKQAKLSDFKSTFKVYVDSREKGSGVIKKLIDEGVNIEMKRMDVADYIISERVGIERKTIRDFVDSIVDGRLLGQVRDLKNNFESPLIILEGEEDIFSVRRVHANAILGMMCAIVNDFKVPILTTKNSVESANLIQVLCKREQKDKVKDFGVRVERKPLTSKEQQEFIIESLPLVGPLLAKSILKEFKSVKNVINASEEDFKKIEKLGDIKAREIRSIIEEVYPE